MYKEINEWFRTMPLFYCLHSDDVFDEAFVFKGYVFIISVLFLPITLPLYLVGKYVPKIFEGKPKRSKK